MMRVPFLDNELLLGAMELFTGEGVDLDTAERAFAGTRGDFRAKLTAALQAVTVARLKPERFVEIPANPESLSKAELWALVEPNIGFIRSSASKAELVDALTTIRSSSPFGRAGIARSGTVSTHDTTICRRCSAYSAGLPCLPAPTGPRMPRSSSCAIRSPCSSARSRHRGCRGPTGRYWLRLPGCCPALSSASCA
jgi:hypothetical protein